MSVKHKSMIHTIYVYIERKFTDLQIGALQRKKSTNVDMYFRCVEVT